MPEPETSDLREFCEAAQQKIADADAVRAGGLKDPASVAIFARLMFEAGYEEASYVAMRTLRALQRERQADA